MGRIRTIKPEFPQSESMGRVSRDARLLFVELWTICDDEGRTRAASRMLASLLFPYDDDAPRLIDGWLAELEAEGCIVRYHVEGATYLQVCNWLSHQKIDKPSRSKLPQFDESSRILSKPLEASSLDQGPRTRDQGPGTKDQGGDRVAPAAAVATCKKPAKDKPEVAIGSATFEAYATAYRKRYSTDPVRNAKVNALLKQLVDRLGAEAAPEVARFYVEHNSDWYIRRGHAIDVLLGDAEKLHTEWQTGRRVTAIGSRQSERTQHHADLVSQLKTEFQNG